METERRYQAALDAFRDDSPYLSGLDQAAGAMTFPKAPAKAGLNWKMVFAGSSAVALVVVAMTLSSRAKAVTVEDISQALKSVPACHSVLHRSDGSVLQENWQEGTKRRYRLSGAIDRGFDGKTVWVLFPERKVAIFGHDVKDGFGYDYSTIDQTVASYVWYFKEKPRVTNHKEGDVVIVTADGTSKYSKNPVRYKFYCREGDKLPYRIESYSVVNGKERLGSYTENEFPKSFPEDVFAFHRPEGYALYDHQGAALDVERGTKGDGPSATVSGVTIHFLGAWQDERGQVTALWSGGAMPHLDADCGILDMEGNGYKTSLAYEEGDRNRPRNHGDRKLAKVLETKTKRWPSGLKPNDAGPITAYCWFGNTPIYALQAQTEVIEPNIARRLKLVLPVFAKGPMRVLRVGTKGMYFKSEGHQVGKAVFEVETSPVQYPFQVTYLFDKNPVRSYGSLPLKGIAVDKERAMKLSMDSLIHRFPSSPVPGIRVVTKPAVATRSVKK